MRNVIINSIEEILSESLRNLSNDDYLVLINGNESLQKYDRIMALIDNGDYPPNYIDQITDEELQEILNYLYK